MEATEAQTDKGGSRYAHSSGPTLLFIFSFFATLIFVLAWGLPLVVVHGGSLVARARVLELQGPVFAVTLVVLQHAGSYFS